jgi:hypothetical protein
MAAVSYLLYLAGNEASLSLPLTDKDALSHSTSEQAEGDIETETELTSNGSDEALLTDSREMVGRGQQGDEERGRGHAFSPLHVESR